MFSEGVTTIAFFQGPPGKDGEEGPAGPAGPAVSFWEFKEYLCPFLEMYWFYWLGIISYVNLIKNNSYVNLSNEQQHFIIKMIVLIRDYRLPLQTHESCQCY